MTQMFSRATPAAASAPAPTPTPPPTMPDPNSAATLEARRKALADNAVGGRQSTILTTAASRASSTLAAGGKLGAS